MRSITVIIVLALLVLAGSASADITLKKSFWSGWKFSLDGEKFERVGMSGAKLRTAMAGDDEAQSLMDKYRGKKTWAFVSGFIGGGLIGWPIGGYIGSSEWEDYYTPMIVTGSVLAIVEAVVDASATRSLKAAVDQYNSTTGPQADKSGAGELAWSVRMAPVGGNQTVLFGLNYRF